MTLERPKSSLNDYTKDSRALDKLMELINDEIIAWIEESTEAPEFGSQAYDEAESMFWDLIKQRINE